MSEENENWNSRYIEEDTPWDSGIPSQQMIRIIEEKQIEPCRAIDIGCGTGTNAIYLAKQGFNVTAVDFSIKAISIAKVKSETAGCQIEFIQADLGQWTPEMEPFDFIFDRGCYHTVRRSNVDGFLRMVNCISGPETRYLSLTGNANDTKQVEGPPQLTKEEIESELGSIFEILDLQEFHFEDKDHLQGPLGWSVFMKGR